MADDGGAEAPNLWCIAVVLARLSRMSLALRVVGFKRLYLALDRRAARIAARRAPGTRTADAGLGDALEPADRLDEARRTAARVVLVNRRYSPIEAGCLVESLALWWTLRRRGIGADLRLGVRTFVGPLQSHSWVEYQGVPLNDSENVGHVFETFDLSEISSDGQAP